MGTRPAVGGSFLALLVAAGAIKSSSAMEWLPVDLTLLAAILVTLAAFWSSLDAVKRREPLAWAWLAAGVALAALGALHRVDSDYARVKLGGLVLTLGVAFGGALLLVRSQRARWGLLVGTVAAGLVVALLAVFAPATDEALAGRIALSEVVTIAPARIAGAAAVVLVTLLLARRVRARLLLAALPVVGLLLYVMIGTASRGPMLGLVAAVVLATVLTGVRGRGLVVVAAVVFIGYRLFTSAASTVQERFLLLLSGSGSESASMRELLWGRSWDQVQAHPLGLGWGGLAPSLYPVADYPHNLVLEVAGEVGIVAGAAAVAVLVLGIVRASRAARAGDPTALAVAALLVFWTVNAMVSGDINDNRGLFVALGAALVLGRRRVGDEPERGELGQQVGKGRVPTA